MKIQIERKNDQYLLEAKGSSGNTVMVIGSENMPTISLNSIFEETMIPKY